MKKITIFTLALFSSIFCISQSIDNLVRNEPTFSVNDAPDIFFKGDNALFFHTTSAFGMGGGFAQRLFKLNSNDNTPIEVSIYKPYQYIAINDNEFYTFERFAGNSSSRLVYRDLNDNSNNAVLATRSATPNFSGIMYEVNGKILFFNELSNSIGMELYAIDIATNTLSLVSDINVGIADSSAENINYIKSNVSGQDKIYFTATSGFVAGTPETEVWVSDGTTAGTMKLVDVTSSGNSGSNELQVFGSDMYFSADDNNGNGIEPWYVDLSASSLNPISLGNISPNSNSLPGNFTRFNGFTYFSAGDSTGRELWRTNNTLSGTVKVDVDPTSPTGSNPTEITAVGNNLFMAARRGVAGREIVRMATNGVMVSYDINSTSTGAGSDPINLFDGGDYLYFTALDGQIGYEPYRINTNTFVRELLGDIAKSGSSTPKFYLEFDNKVVFSTTGNVREAFTIDNVPSSCSSVINTTVNAEGSDWIYLTFDKNGNTFETQFLEVFTANPAQNEFGSTPIRRQELSDPSDSYIYTNGLNANTAYVAYLKNYCTDGTFERLGPFGFTTTASCTPVSNFTVSTITNNSVTVNWNNDAQFIDGYTVEVYERDTAFLDVAPILSATEPNGSNSATLTGLVADTDYDIYIYGNCSSNSRSNPSNTKQQFTTAQTLSNEDFIQDQISIFPNPANNSITIKDAKSEVSAIEIFDITGKQISQFKASTNDIYDVSHLSNGMYLLKVISINGGTVTKKLIKN